MIKSSLSKAKFKNQTIIDYDGIYFSFIDIDENIYLLERKNFGITIIDTKEIIINNFKNQSIKDKQKE